MEESSRQQPRRVHDGAGEGIQQTPKRAAVALAARLPPLHFFSSLRSRHARAPRGGGEVSLRAPAAADQSR